MPGRAAPIRAGRSRSGCRASSTVGFWDARHPQDWGLDTHCNEGFKIAYLARGSLDLVVDGVPHAFEQGQFIIIRPWQLHSIGSPNIGSSRLLWIMLDGGLRRRAKPGSGRTG